MKPVEELLAGVLLFFIVDRASRFISAWLVETRRMDDMKTEKIRSGIETVIMLAVFLILWYRLKR
jgi:cytochrome c1